MFVLSYGGEELGQRKLGSSSHCKEGRLSNDNLVTLCRYHHEQAEKNIISKEELFALVDKVERGGGIPPWGENEKNH